MARKAKRAYKACLAQTDVQDKRVKQVNLATTDVQVRKVTQDQQESLEPAEENRDHAVLREWMACRDQKDNQDDQEQWVRLVLEDLLERLGQWVVQAKEGHKGFHRKVKEEEMVNPDTLVMREHLEHPVLVVEQASLVCQALIFKEHRVQKEGQVEMGIQVFQAISEIQACLASKASQELVYRKSARQVKQVWWVHRVKTVELDKTACLVHQVDQEKEVTVAGIVPMDYQGRKAILACLGRTDTQDR